MAIFSDDSENPSESQLLLPSFFSSLLENSVLLFHVHLVLATHVYPWSGWHSASLIAYTSGSECTSLSCSPGTGQGCDPLWGIQGGLGEGLCVYLVQIWQSSGGPAFVSTANLFGLTSTPVTVCLPGDGDAGGFKMW